jgi:segregation and condensation protein B
MSDQNSLDTDINLAAQIEALLFVASGPVTLSQLAAALDISVTKVEAGLTELQDYYNQRALRLQEHGNGIQLTTAPEIAWLIERFLDLEITSRLSQAALETLAIIAYKQPVIRPEIEAIRGVSSDGVLKSLLSKGMVQDIGRAERPGRPILYTTTPEFLQVFGLNSLDELPPLEGTQDQSEDNHLVVAERNPSGITDDDQNP